MYYTVAGTLNADTTVELLRKLGDQSIKNVPSDGAEIHAALMNAVMTGDGRVKWSMGCLCLTPLGREREVVLDHYFDSLDVQPGDSTKTLEGPSFM